MATFDLQENMYVKKGLAGVEDLTRGFSQENQIRAGEDTSVTQINASHFRGVMTFKTLDELKKVETRFMGEYKTAVVEETGQIYFFNGTKWETANNITYQVQTLSDLVNVPKEVAVCVVTDSVRGGVFYYDESQKDVNNDGTIINGWVRQFDGAINVKWFGAVGNGVTDDRAAIQKVLDSYNSVFIPDGTYLISATLNVKQKTNITGGGNSVIYSQEDITFVKLASEVGVFDLRFSGVQDKYNQVGILVDGGASLGECHKTIVSKCRFSQVGGDGYRVINVSSEYSNICSNNIFVNCGVGVNIELKGSGTSVTGCVFDNCQTGIKSKGAKAEIVGCSLTQNNYGVVLASGDSTPSKTIFSSCGITNSKTYSIYANGVNSDSFMFSDCVIDSVNMFQNAEQIKFFNCNLTSASITFSSSNNNYFMNCICDGLNVTNDYQGSKTKNYFVDPLVKQDSSDFSSDGGFVKAKLVSNTQSLNQNTINVVKFNEVEQGLPFHQNFTKESFYDSSSGTFDLTKVFTPASKNMINCNIQICLNTNDATQAQKVCVFLYKVDSPSEAVTTNLSQEKVVAVLTPSYNVFGNYRNVLTLSGQIPRGMYKLLAKVLDVSSLQIVKEGDSFVGSGKTISQATFWGM